jgi:hypothetical protein
MVQSVLEQEESNRQDERRGRIRAEQRLKAAALELAEARASSGAPPTGTRSQPPLHSFSLKTIGFVESVFSERCATCSTGARLR